MSITFNIQDFGDNSSLQVPPMSPIDGRFPGSTYLRPISLSVSDKDIDSSKSCRFPRGRKEKGILHRPVSDQGLHEPVKKEVSWHSKIPTSVQTLSCVEDTATPVNMEQLSNDEKHAQSQPILGTLESSSKNQYVCRHTFSVRQSYSSSKENRKVWNLKRSSSEEKSKVKDKFIPFSLKSSSTPATDSNCSSSSSILCDSRLSVMDTSRDDQFSLIDWEEDEKACDAEVQNIIGENDADEEEDEKPTPSLPIQTSLDFGADTPVQYDSNKTDTTLASSNNNFGPDSRVTVRTEPVEVTKTVNECKENETTKGKDVCHSKGMDVMGVTETVVMLHDNYADKEHISEESTCSEKPLASNDHIRINIPLDNLSVPSPCGMKGENFLAVPSGARDSSPYQHERRKEESHL